MIKKINLTGATSQKSPKDIEKETLLQNPEISKLLLEISDLDDSIQVVKNHERKNIAIIGSGPSGLTAAIYTARASISTKIFAGSMPGGQLTTTTEIENFPGAWNSQTKQGMMGPDLMKLIEKQAEHFGADIVPDEISKITLN